MIFFYRLYLKFALILTNIKKEAVIQISIKRGLKIGKGIYIEGVPSFGSEPFLVEIGDYCTIAEGVHFICHAGDARVTKRIEKYKDARYFGRIKVGNNSFIGINSIILPGVQIGDNCILGAGSVLSSSMPNNTVYGGIPAKYICTIEEYGDKLLELNLNYPLEIEKSRKLLEEYIIKHTPYEYKAVRPKK